MWYTSVIAPTPECMDCNNCTNGTEADGEEADTGGDYATETWVHYGSILAGKMWSMKSCVK